MRDLRPILIFLLLGGVFFINSPLHAQSVYGQIQGYLTGEVGKPVKNALVTVSSTETQAKYKVRTNKSGYFVVNNLVPSHYDVLVQANGYKTVQTLSLPVGVDSPVTINGTLPPGDSHVIVSGPSDAVSMLQIDRAEVSTFFDARTLATLPVLDRNVTLFQLLVPSASSGKLFIANLQNPQGGVPVNVNGQHFSGSAFQVDGTENRDALEGIAIINPALESVQEMKVTTQGFNADVGQATAGVVFIQTRSGTDKWHGDAFGYRRTGWGESSDPFAPEGVPPGKHSIFGGSVGGPILRNKLFIFSDYQGLRFSTGANVLLNVPTRQVRDTCLGSKGSPGSRCDLSEYSDFIHGHLHDIDPTTGLPIQYPDNKIPNSRISDQAVALLNLLPRPNQASAGVTCGAGTVVCDNYFVSGAEILNGDLVDVRADYNFSSALRFFGRYSLGRYSDTGAPAFGASGGGIGVNPLGFAGVVHTLNQGVSAGFTDSLGPKLVTDFRFGFVRYRLNQDSQDFGQIPVPKADRIPGIFPPQTTDPLATGIPEIEIPGQQTTDKALLSSVGDDYLLFGYSLAANNCNCPLREREQQFQFVNNWTRDAGRHLIKWGTDLRYLQNHRLASRVRRTGSFGFAQDVTGLGLATFLIGDATSFNRFVSSPVATDAGERQKRFGFYGQDTWRINSHLTLNYGLRWEIYFPQTVNVAGSFLLPSFSNPDAATTFFNVAPTPSPSGGVRSSLKNFAPRLGIAYLLKRSTVFRVGYGRSFDAGYGGDIFGIAPTQNPPITVNQNVPIDFNLKDGPPPFNFPNQQRFSLLDLATLNNAGTSLNALPSSVRVPTVDSWNFAIQHQLASSMYFELAYTGNKGTDVFTDSNSGASYNLNQPSLKNIILTTTNPMDQRCQPDSYFPNKNSPAHCLAQPLYRAFYQESPRGCGTNPKCVFDPTQFPVQYFGNNASDNYNALQARLQKNFKRGYSFMAHYTWAKGFDYDSNYFRVDPTIGYGPSLFDITHRFVLTNILELPFGRGKAWFGGIGRAADRFVGGWTLSAITVWRSGLPFTPSYKNCGREVDANSPCRPNVVGLVHITGTREQYFSTTGGVLLPGNDCNPNKVCGVDPEGHPIAGPPVGPWQRPGAGQIGDVERNSFRGPGFFQSDIALAKVTMIAERTNLKFRVDAFNVFNKVNLGQPNPCVDCGGSGTISSLAIGAIQRTLQFSLQLDF